MNPLFFALKYNTDILPHLHLVNTEFNGDSPLLCACKLFSQRDTINDINLLLDANANIQYADNQGNTPLIVLASTLVLDTDYKVKIVDKIIKSSNLDATDAWGFSALIHSLCNPTNQYCAKLLQSRPKIHSNKHDVLHFAAKYANLYKFNAVETLLNGGAQINLQDSDGFTALIFACRYSNDCSNNDIVACLLKRGANIELRDRCNRDALVWACLYSNGTNPKIDPWPDFSDSISNIETVKILLNHGAQPPNDCLQIGVQIASNRLMQVLVSNYANNKNDEFFACPIIY